MVEDEEERVDGGPHQQLCDTSTEVTPSTGDGIRCTHDIVSEHGSCPVLIHDESGADGANEEAYDTETLEGGDGPDEEGGEGADDEYSRHHCTRTIHVTERTTDESHANGRGKCAYVGDVDLVRGEVEGLLDREGHQRSDRKPGHEGREEADPGRMEGPHMGSLDGEDLDFGGPMVLSGVCSQIEVSRVFSVFQEVLL